jgi:hypothetical protein
MRSTFRGPTGASIPGDGIYAGDLTISSCPVSNYTLPNTGGPITIPPQYTAYSANPLSFQPAIRQPASWTTTLTPLSQAGYQAVVKGLT